MTNNKILFKQKKIAKALQRIVHPDNPLAFEMTKRYRELEQLKTK